LAAITSRTIKATRTEADGKTVEPETILFKSGKYFASTAYGKVAVTEGFDGLAGWKASDKGPINLRPDETEQLKREAELFSPANLKAVYPKMDFRFLDRIDGREAYMITASTAGNVRERLWFDVQTGLLIRRSAATQTVLGNFIYQVDYADYKMFGGVKVPTRITYSVPNIRWTRKITEVRNNAPVDDVRFAKP
jgi:hypothetical protein